MLAEHFLTMYPNLNVDIDGELQQLKVGLAQHVILSLPEPVKEWTLFSLFEIVLIFVQSVQSSPSSLLSETPFSISHLKCKSIVDFSTNVFCIKNFIAGLGGIIMGK